MTGEQGRLRRVGAGVVAVFGIIAGVADGRAAPASPIVMEPAVAYTAALQDAVARLNDRLVGRPGAGRLVAHLLLDTWVVLALDEGSDDAARIVCVKIVVIEQCLVADLWGQLRSQ